MAISAEQLNVILSARDKEFQRKMRDAERRVAYFKNRSNRNLSSVGRSFDQLGRAARVLAPLLAGVFTVQTIKNLTRSAAEIGKLADLAGTSAEELQFFAAGARTVGFEMDKVADIIKDVNDKVGDFLATGGGPMKDFFENIAPQVGVTAEQFARLSGPEALQLYVNSLEQANLSQAEMTFYMEALANDSTALIPLLRDNGRAMKELGDQAQEAGRILDQDAVDGARELENAARDLSEAFDAELTSAFADNQDALVSLINYIKDTAVPQIGGLIRLIGAAVDEYRMLRGLEPFGSGGAPAEETPEDLERYRRDVERAGELGGGDVSGTGQFYVDENGNVREFGTDTQNIPGVTAPAVSVPSSLLGSLTGATDTGGGSSRRRGGGGGGSAVDQLADLREEYSELLATLANVSDAQEDFNDAQQVLNDALQAGAITQQEYNSAMSISRQRFQEATLEASALGEVMDTVQYSMESAFMSMIDGTMDAKDAFRAMAADIIRELYRVLVVQQLVGSFSSGGGGILGGIFSALKGKASGGTVQAGQPYMTGESGRELFVPQTNGRILSPAQTSNAMRGGGENVIVQQTINVSTGVQQTVRNEIKSMMPQIAESAKGAVADAKRRGGSYGRAFA